MIPWSSKQKYAIFINHLEGIAIMPLRFSSEILETSGFVNFKLLAIYVERKLVSRLNSPANEYVHRLFMTWYYISF
jgi:hypothetical protein